MTDNQTENVPVPTGEEKFAFLAEWYESESALLRKFYLFYFPADSTLSLFDINKNRTFLKRTRVDNVEKRDIFVGNIINIFSRHVKITGYANIFTQRVMGRFLESTCVIIKPDACRHLGVILRMISNDGFQISELRMMKLTTPFVEKFYAHKKDSTNFTGLLTFMTSGPVVAMELINEDGVNRMQRLCGPTNPDEARRAASDSIRACFGSDDLQNAIHSSSSVEESKLERELLFGKSALPCNPETDTVVLENSTCCIIKPHAVRDGRVGDILLAIQQAGFTITAMRMFRLNSVNAEEFLEIYRGVVPEYTEMVSELVNGACVALEVVGSSKEGTAKDFRTFVGPMDPDLAKKLRPKTLRAMFGKDKVLNAIHVTDLPADAPLEVEYFFKLLAT